MKLTHISETCLTDQPLFLTNFRTCPDLKVFSSDKRLFAVKPDHPEKTVPLPSPHKKPIKKLIMSPISKLLVTVSESDQIVVWSVESLKILKKFFLPKKSESKLVDLAWTNFHAGLILFFDKKIVMIKNICHLGELTSYDC